MKPLCEYCGTRHESYQGHVFATNTATNRNATNKRSGDGVSGGSPISGGVELGSKVDEAGGGFVVQARTKNRRSREAYNAYQREYMRKKRAK
jgi:hypothetical protein